MNCNDTFNVLHSLITIIEVELLWCREVISVGCLLWHHQGLINASGIQTQACRKIQIFTITIFMILLSVVRQLHKLLFQFLLPKETNVVNILSIKYYNSSNMNHNHVHTSVTPCGHNFSSPTNNFSKIDKYLFNFTQSKSKHYTQHNSSFKYLQCKTVCLTTSNTANKINPQSK